MTLFNYLNNLLPNMWLWVLLIILPILIILILRNFEIVEITFSPPWVKLKKREVGAPKLYQNLPQSDIGFFIGREDELTQIGHILRPYPHSQNALITIDGVGGIGKTALALEAAHRQLRNVYRASPKERFDAIIWVSAKQNALSANGIVARRQALRTLQDIHSAIAVTLEREDIMQSVYVNEQAEMIRRALTQQRTLLIVDNLETVDDEAVIGFLQELPAPTKAIVTTRHRIDVAYPIRLVGMQWADIQILIAEECKKKQVTLSDVDARRLYDRTGGVPLAIVWSIAQIGFGYTIDTVLSRLGQSTSDIARFCFEKAMENIRGKPSHLLLVALAIIDENLDRNSLGYITDLPELDRDEGLVEIEKLSLINRDRGRFVMLPLTREYARGEASLDREQRQVFENRYKQWLQRSSIKEGTRAYHRVAGIDFGTTYSKISIWDNLKGEVTVIPTATGMNVLPSVISLDRDGNVIVGEPALNNLISDPLNTIVDIKRELGTYEHEPNYQTGSLGDPKRIHFRGSEYFPHELAAFILIELRRQAESYLGVTVKDAVISVPAYFHETQKAAIINAANLAGLNVRVLLNEPTAASVSFGTDKVLGEGQHIYAVYDLGGGTFDVSIISVTKDEVSVIGTGGNPRLGGSDFDQRITNYVLEYIKVNHRVDLSNDPIVRARIRREAELTKRQLSATSTSLLSLPYLTNQISLEVPISRELFETLIQDLLASTLFELDRAIASANSTNGISREDIEQVLLVGGSTRIPAIRKMVASHMGLDLSDVRSDLNPDEVVSRGAAIVARSFPFTNEIAEGGTTKSYSDQLPIVLLDVTSHTLGILAEDGNMLPIIPKDSAIPIRITKGPFTNSNNAKEFQVKIFQGEDQIAFNNTFIGELSIDLPEARESGYYKFEIIFTLDTSGVLDVSVTSLNDEKKWKTAINAGARATNEQIEQSRRKITEAFPSQR